MEPAPEGGHPLLRSAVVTWPAQPFVQDRDENGRLPADRKRAVPGGHGVMRVEAIDAALDRVPGFVVLERGGQHEQGAAQHGA